MPYFQCLCCPPPYLRDFEKFVALWHQELEHLNAHRAHSSSERSR